MTYQLNFKGEKVVPVGEGQTILQASLDAGIPHYHACGGKGQCTTCRVLVLEGAEQLTPPTNLEQAIRKVKSFPENVRLACQAKVKGNGVAVQRLIRDDVDRRILVDEPEENMTSVIGESRKLALFFIDIRDFTPFVEKSLPFDVIHVMRRIFALYKNAITQYNGEIIDTAGDGLYAVFGLKSRIREATESAVRAGMKILTDLRIFNNSYMRPYFNHTFEVGIGVHVGRVIVGNVGIGLSQNLTVMGFPVNIAARLQDATKELDNSFVISSVAYRLLRNPPDAVGCNYLNLKGVSTPYEVKLIGKPYEKKDAAVVTKSAPE